MRLNSTILLALAVSASAAPAYLLKEKRHHAPRAERFHRRVGAAPPDALHTIVFAVTQRNATKLRQTFEAVSDPRSSSYGNFLSYEEVGQLIENKEGTKAVTTWLAAEQVSDVTAHPHGEYITARATVATWNRLLRMELHEHASADGRRIYRGTEYHLPAHVHPHVTAAFYTVHLPHPSRPRAMRVQANVQASSGTVAPAALNSYYNIASNDASAKGHAQSLYESLNQNYSPDDLNQFQSQFSIPARKIAKDVGAHNMSINCVMNPNNCGEANLDVQYLMAVAQNVDTWFWYSTESSFAAWIVAVAGTANPPLVQSISYGGYETETPQSLKDQFSTEAQKLGVQGVSIVIASGDDGVSNFEARTDPKQCGYHPSWPATSPFATAVGATEGPESGKDVTVCSTANGVNQGYAHATLITSGGGFSDAFAAPSYQTAAIANYFKTAKTAYGPGYNTTGRGYPDVGMLGHSYEVVIAGKTYLVDGTSAAAPVFAGVLSLVNSARIAKGKSPVGFANTALYQLASSNPEAFLDVTTGANNCCGDASPLNCCSDAGFYAAAGWDPVTGLGGVDVAKLTAAWVAL